VTGSAVVLALAVAAVALLVVAIFKVFAAERRAAEVQQAMVGLSAQAGEARESSRQVGDRLAGLTAELTQRLASFEKTVDERIRASQDTLGQNLGTMQQQSAESARMLKAVGENLGRVFEASQKIEKLAGDVTRLEDLLKPPKIRGTLGETFLEEALRQCLPPGSWNMQWRFSDGEAVDATIAIGERVVPVDSKFPLENYRRAAESGDESERRRARREFGRDVRKHVDAIALKYIRVAEGTYDFALMYVPAEAVYAEIVADGEEAALADYAISRHVIPVSPRLLYAYLSTIAQGLQGLEIEKRAHEILDELARLKRGVAKIEDPLGKLGTHLGNAQKSFEETQKQLVRFSERLREVSELESGADEPHALGAAVDRPEDD
jgi:DNA recombination protein RmuC